MKGSSVNIVASSSEGVRALDAFAAYSWVVAFGLVASASESAPDLDRRLWLVEAAARRARRAAEAGRDTGAAMSQFVPALDAYRRRLANEEWISTLIAVRFFDRLRTDLVRHLGGRLGRADLAFADRIDGELRGACSARVERDRLRLWLRQITADSVAFVQGAVLGTELAVAASAGRDEYATTVTDLEGLVLTIRDDLAAVIG